MLHDYMVSRGSRACGGRLGLGDGGVELGLWILLTLSVKGNQKKNNSSAKINSRPRQILLGNLLATCTILSCFFDSGQLFGE